MNDRRTLAGGGLPQRVDGDDKMFLFMSQPELELLLLECESAAVEMQDEASEARNTKHQAENSPDGSSHPDFKKMGNHSGNNQTQQVHVCMDPLID